MVLWPRWKLAHHGPSSVYLICLDKWIYSITGQGALTWRYCADCGSPCALGANKSSASLS